MQQAIRDDAFSCSRSGRAPHTAMLGPFSGHSSYALFRREPSLWLMPCPCRPAILLPFLSLETNSQYLFLKLR